MPTAVRNSMISKIDGGQPEDLLVPLKVELMVPHIYSCVSKSRDIYIDPTHLNSRLSALTASLALASLAEARSQTSSTRLQSSLAVAVKKPIIPHPESIN